MSITSVMLPILSVLSVAQETHIGYGYNWVPVNKNQEVFVEQYLPKTQELEFLKPEEIRSCASKDVAEVNTFLRDNGFAIQLEEGSELSIYVASILDIALKWKEAGTKTQLAVEGTTYPAVSMKKGYSIERAKDGRNILAIACDNGDTVYMTLADKSIEGFELLEAVQQLAEDTQEVTHEYAGVTFPMVELSQKEDISWLIGLWYNNPLEWKVMQALQETRFSMNEKGARAQSAVAVELEPRCMPTKPQLVIDGAFYLWIERPGMSVPLFAGYIDKGDWKEPAGIS